MTIRKFILEVADDGSERVKSEIEKLEREWGIEEIEAQPTDTVGEMITKDEMFFKIIQDIEESDEQQVSYNEEFQLSKYAYVMNNAETFKEMGYQVINEEGVFGFDTVYLKRNKKAQPTEMRDATEEERKSVKNYIESISKPTGVHFYEAQPTEECEENGSPWCLGHCPYNTDAQPTDAEREAYIKGYDYGVKDWFKSKTQPCDDCISRKAVDKIINKWLSHPDYELKDNIYDMTKKIHKLPSVTPQRMQGKWIDTDDNLANCSNCGYQIDIHQNRGYMNYCPNCGSYNGGGEDEVGYD